MANPMVWVLVAVAAILLCTGHLCLGLVIGRHSRNDLLRSTKRVLSQELQQSKAQESIADRLTEEVERIAAMSHSLTGSVGRSVEAALQDLLQAAENLRGSLHSGTQRCAEALKGLSDPKRNGAPRSRQSRAPPVIGLELEDDDPGDQSGPGGAAKNERPFARAPLPNRHSTAQLAEDEIASLRTGDAPAHRESSRDQRNDVRYPYNTSQFIAEIHGNAFPNAEDFVPVACRDISQRGISFFIPDLPASDDLIVTIGRPPDLIFIKVEVVNTRPSCLEGVVGYTVGCAFQARLGAGIYAWDAECGAVVAAAPWEAATVPESGRTA